MKLLARALSLVTVGLSLFAACVPPAWAGTLAADDLFTLKDVDGKDVSLAQQLKTHKAVLVNFWATWCPPCNEEIPDLIRLQDKYKDRSFTVIGVDVGESARKVSAFAKRKKMNYPLVLDQDHSVSERYQVVGIPTSLLVLSDGTIVGEYHAAGSNVFDAVEKAVQ